MDSERNAAETVVTQVSIGGFDSNVKANDLRKYLEDKIGLVWRCRLKTSWTPPESYPKFDVVEANDDIQITDTYRRVVPHAFVHFALPDSATSAKDAAMNGLLTFSSDGPLKVSLGPENPFRLNQRRRTSTPFKIPNVQLEIGTLVTQDQFFVSWKGPDSGLDFLVDPFDGTCKFCFTRQTFFSFKNSREHAVLNCDYKMEFLVRDVLEIKRYTETTCFVILLQLAAAPQVWYRTADDDIEVMVPWDLLDDDDPWIRTTDFTTSGAVGRCNFYRVSVQPRHGNKLLKAMAFLKERRVQEDCLRRPLKIANEPDFGSPMTDVFFYVHGRDGVSFDEMYLVNAVLHRGIFNQHQISDKFFDILRKQPAEINVAALKQICSYKRPVFDASKELEAARTRISRSNNSIKLDAARMEDLTEIRRLVITPTRAYCLPPEVELSNRVLRKYKDVGNRFLRVTFMDEGFQTINSSAFSYYVAPIVRDIISNPFPQKTSIFKRVRSILTDGFYLCGRRYTFLAFSSNQLRDRSAWFFAEDGTINTSGIRAWMGRFKNRNVAKCAARMGQCFSSTYASVEVPSYEVNEELADIERNGYNFSDGIGMITPDLAQEVAVKLKLDADPPCAYQIRYAGCKGVVACWPALEDGSARLSLRPSMNKFLSTHMTLEICSWTRFQAGFLNRQIITLLSALDVPDSVFWDMQQKQLSKLNRMLVDTDVAFEVLTASCAEQGTVAAALMLSAGFDPRTEPHLRGMLTSIRASQLWGLREKSRIFVESGRWLMGVLDEVAVLEQGQCFIQVSKPSLQNVFVKHGSKFKDTKKDLRVVTGTVVIAKNPCLHPGDVRVLEAVDNPSLHHLYDCLVFPQNGERPHSNEASGSDLDGDLYFVTWDEDLIPPSRRSWPPMQYDPVEAKLLGRDVNTTDIIEFFVKNMVNENLGAICNAHVVHADLSDYGAHDEKCITLAELAATAVDFPKTGKLVTMPGHLKPKLYPDFMGKEENQSYKSTKILGRLYHQVKDAVDEDEERPKSSSKLNEILYDGDLMSVLGTAGFVMEAWDLKCSYDKQLRGLLLQYKVKYEEEIVTGHVWSMPKSSSKKQGELKERLKHAYSSLRKEFRQIFENTGDEAAVTEDEKNSVLERKAAAWYQVTYSPRWANRSLELLEVSGGAGSANGVMLSFPWIAADYLARIKVRSRGRGTDDPAKPINRLRRYLAERM
ncbi:RNA-dependent RNA polymerase 6 [Linum grandiflorum]